MEQILILILMLISTLGFPKEALGQYYSQGEVKNSISIDKKIRPISDTKSWDNIDKSEKLFVQGDKIDFSITVENTGNQEINDLNLTDYLPKFQEIVFNPGSYSENGQTIKWTIDKLGVGESKVFIIRSKIGNVNKFEQILTNKVCVSNSQVGDCDQASFFVTGKSVPSTGSEALIFQSLVGVFGIMGAWSLRKAARGY